MESLELHYLVFARTLQYARHNVSLDFNMVCVAPELLYEAKMPNWRMRYSHVVYYTPNASRLERRQSKAILMRACMAVPLRVSLAILGTMTPPAFYLPAGSRPVTLTKDWDNITDFGF